MDSTLNQKDLPGSELTPLIFVPGVTRFIPSQVILTGKDNHLTAILNEFETEGIPITRTNYEINIGGEMTTRLIPDSAFVFQKYHDIKIILCDVGYFPGNVSIDPVWHAVQLVYDKAFQNQYIVFAEPNYIAGDPGPGGGAGGINGCPGGGLGGLSDIDLPSNNTGGRSAVSVYQTHWAFGPSLGAIDPGMLSGYAGINLEMDSSRKVDNQTGKDVNVLIFDTFNKDIDQFQDLSYPPTLSNNPPNVQIERIPIDEKFDFTASEPVLRYKFDEPSNLLDNVNDHGGYIAGLVHRVAPDAKVYLIRILSEKNLGELFLLLDQLYKVPFHFLNDPDNALRNMVINLSLETLVDDDELESFGIINRLRNLYDLVKENQDQQNSAVLISILEEMVKERYYMASLRVPIQIMHHLGAVIVAAAGNDGDYHLRPIRSDIPGRFPEVISVMASDSAGNLAHFSNLGDVAAPGGGLVAPQKLQPNYVGKNLKDLCKLLRDVTPHAMIGLVPIQNPGVGDPGNPHGMAFWWGTSFAAPLVSGLAALMMEKWGDTKSNVDIENKIKNNTNNGIIDVRKALNDNT